MFARASRLNAARDFAKVYRKGQSARSRLFRIAWLPAARTRIAVVTGRKVSAKAVVRNRLKRQVQAAAAALAPTLAPTELIIQLQAAAAGEPYQALAADLGELIERSRLRARTVA